MWNYDPQAWLICKHNTDGVEMIQMIIHFSASHEDTLITVCLSNYSIVFSVSLLGKEHMGNKLHVIRTQQRMLCGVTILISNARLET